MGSDEPVCCCGHVRDEHVPNKRGSPAECGVDGCPCVHYEREENDDV